MTFEEAIAKYKENAKFFKQTTNIAYGLELEQLAEWLKELKMYRESSYGELYSIVYNKAIDDAKSVILQTIDNETLVDTLHLRLEQLKERTEK